MKGDLESAAGIQELVRGFVEDYKAGRELRTSWREPLVGIASADDPLFPTLKEIVGPTHCMPEDMVADAKSVIVYFFPFAEDEVRSNIADEESSVGWDYSNIETNELIKATSHFLFERLAEKGFEATDLPPTYNYDPVALRADWSHKSAAYIAGLGTFGVNRTLITKSGCCGRFGSTITAKPLEPTPRPDVEYCLWKRSGKCGACVRRCPMGALSVEAGIATYDRQACNYQIYEKIVPQYPEGSGDACGKCMVGVPCALKAPGISS